MLDGDFDRRLLDYVSILKLAEEEARVVGPVAELGVREVVVTSGARGSTVYANGEVVRVPAHPLHADPTGAGDAFCAVYLSARADGQRPSSAARRATAAVAALLSSR